MFSLPTRTHVPGLSGREITDFLSVPMKLFVVGGPARISTFARWFRRGYESGKLELCDTFKSGEL